MTVQELKQEEHRRFRCLKKIDDATMSLTDADNLEYKIGTQMWCNFSETGATSKYERAKKVTEEISEDFQFRDNRWSDEEPANIGRHTEEKENIDELKEQIESGELVDVKEDPELTTEMAYHLCYNKTTSGEHDYEHCEAEDAARHQQAKLDWRTDSELNKFRHNGGFF